MGYIYLPDGRILKEETVRAGYANVMTVEYQGRLFKANGEVRGDQERAATIFPG